jgi:hypothetical protein
MNVTDYTVEEPNKDVVASQSEYEIAKKYDHIQSLDIESTLEAKKNFNSSISPEHTIKVCWSIIIIYFFIFS